MTEREPNTGYVDHLLYGFRFRFHPYTLYKLAGTVIGLALIVAALDIPITQAPSAAPTITPSISTRRGYTSHFRQKTGEAYFIDWPVPKGEYTPSEDDPFLRPVGGAGVTGLEVPLLVADRESRTIAVARSPLEAQQAFDLPAKRVSVEDAKKFLEQKGVKYEHLQPWGKPAYQAIVKKPLLLHSYPDRNTNDFPRLGQQKSVYVIRPGDQFEIFFSKHTGIFLVYVINPVKEKIEEWMFVLPAQAEELVLTQSSKKDSIIIAEPFAFLLNDKKPGDKAEPYAAEIRDTD